MGDRVVRVVPDETGLTKTFDYVVPDRWSQEVEIGTRVRIPLGARRVGAWIVALDVEPPPGVELRAVSRVSGLGPDAELVRLAQWAQWRWAARSPVPFLRTASPPRTVMGLPVPPSRVGLDAPVPASGAPAGDALVTGAFGGGPAVLRLAPCEDLLAVVTAAAATGTALVICPSRAMVRTLVGRARRSGLPVAVHPEDWPAAAAGGSLVVGTRSAAWARVGDLSAVVVLDEHDEVHQEEGSPTWHARDVALERARRAGVPAVLTSPLPTLEALDAARLVPTDRSRERAGWPACVVVDRRSDDVARNALISPQLADIIRSAARVVCVLNQKGRAALLACARCHEIARCEACGAALHKPEDDLVCRRCATTRPVVCGSCGDLRLRTIRLGVGRVRDDLEAMAGEPVLAVTAETPLRAIDDARLFVGTEAVLHQVERADVVAFLDFDQELLAPRYRAAEEALGLVARAARLVGGRGRGGRVVLQTRLPDHEVCRAAVLGDPARVSEVARAQRGALGLPPTRALAEVGGQAAEAFVSRIPAAAGIMVQGPVEGRWRLSAPDHATLCDGLAAVERPPGRLRLAVDPLRL